MVTGAIPTVNSVLSPHRLPGAAGDAAGSGSAGAAHEVKGMPARANKARRRAPRAKATIPSLSLETDARPDKRSRHVSSVAIPAFRQPFGEARKLNAFPHGGSRTRFRRPARNSCGTPTAPRPRCA
ncbi:hypothetical protein GCM10009090_34260 [[Pseudomonas] boreopolis]|uniref:Uncharacterized protein n=1 Tax=Xanthomonas boreopolis TaxID=86183 RepID=A0A919FBQ5_9XANT|nr:hypothetical protein GCM10009090_34260 [[Pseudomonas] boreopolis]